MNTLTNNKACIKCKWFEPRSGFCRKNPPIPIIIPDDQNFHMMSAFPKIPAPNLDWCSNFEHINTTSEELLED